MGVDSGEEDVEGQILDDLVDDQILDDLVVGDRMIMAQIFSSHHIALSKTIGIAGMMEFKIRKMRGLLRAAMHYQIELVRLIIISMPLSRPLL